jgi:hypothetical protein
LDISLDVYRTGGALGGCGRRGGHTQAAEEAVWLGVEPAERIITLWPFRKGDKSRIPAVIGGIAAEEAADVVEMHHQQ